MYELQVYLIIESIMRQQSRKLCFIFHDPSHSQCQGTKIAQFLKKKIFLWPRQLPHKKCMVISVYL